MKQCIKCGTVKLFLEFYRRPRAKDGRANRCKECAKAAFKANRASKIEYYREYDKRRAMKPHRVKAMLDYAQSRAGKQKGNAAKAEYTKRNPIKAKTQMLVSIAVKSGTLIKPAQCSECGTEPKLLHGHHDDYALPMVVTWLCPACHTAWHKLNGEGLNG